MSEKANGFVSAETIPSPPAICKTNVGIWKPEYVDGKLCFQRDAKYHKTAYFWADVNLIPEKSSRKRIVLLGESVARGYLFDPYFNPAICLDTLLNASGLIDAEVVDLAKVSIEMEELTQLTKDSLALEPDLMMVFAGNNWFSSFVNDYSKDISLDIGEIISSNSRVANDAGYVDNKVFGQIKKYIENKMSEMTSAYIECLAGLSEANGIPLLFVIPEFNLLDWKSTQAEKILFKISDEDLATWLSAKKEAEKALQERSSDVLYSMSSKMIATDWSHPLGYELLAEYYRLNLNNEEARKCLESARDTAMFGRSSGQARIYNIIQETLISETQKHNIATIDLRDVFMQYLKGNLPGRDLFVDYCHLSEEGIIVAMSSAAKKILELLHIDASSYTEAASAVKIKEDVKAIAYLCAAVHNSHYGQSAEIIQYLCSKAFSYSDVVVDVVKKYTDLASRRITTVLCKSHDDIVESEAILQYQRGAGFISKEGYKLMDIELVDAIVALLRESGDDLEEQVSELRIKEHGINKKGINLLQSFYKHNTYEEYLGKEVPYFQSRDIESNFNVIADDGLSGVFKITYRTPGLSSGKEKVHIQLNGKEIQSLNVSEKWLSADVMIEKGILRRGINKLSIRWPYQRHYRKTAVNNHPDEPIVERLSSVFGEIHQLKALSC